MHIVHLLYSWWDAQTPIIRVFTTTLSEQGTSRTNGPLNNTVRWSADLDEFIGAPPIEKDGRVYVGVWPDINFAPGEESCLSMPECGTDGSEIWKNPLGTGEGTISSAAIASTRYLVKCHRPPTLLHRYRRREHALERPRRHREERRELVRPRFMPCGPGRYGLRDLPHRRDAARLRSRWE